MNQSVGSKPFPHYSSAGIITSAVALSTVMLLAIAGNVLIIVIFRLFERVRKQVTNHFLINLAISDLIVALVTMPFWLLWEIDRWASLPKSWKHETLDTFWTFLDIVCEASSIANLAVVSVDRLYSVSSPFKHHTTVTPSLAHKIIVGVWGYSIATASMYLFETNWKFLVIAILGFFLPLTTMIVCFTKIVFVVRAFRKRRMSNPEGNRQFFGCMVNEYKTAKNLSVVMVAFVICWMPFFVTSLLFHYCESCLPYLKSKPVIPAVTKWLHYLNSALNPILYSFFNPSYRVVFRRFYAWCLHKENPRTTSYHTWYLDSRRVSTNSQWAGTLTTSGTRSSYASVHRPSCGSVTTTRSERAEIVEENEEEDSKNDDVFVDGNMNEEVVKVGEQDDGVTKLKGAQNKVRSSKNSTTKNRVSFCDSDTIL